MGLLGLSMMASDLALGPFVSRIANLTIKYIAGLWSYVMRFPTGIAPHSAYTRDTYGRNPCNQGG